MISTLYGHGLFKKLEITYFIYIIIMKSIIIFIIIAYDAVFLEELTAAHLKDCLARKLSLSPSVITAILLQHTYGILVNVDDLVINI